MSKQLYIVKAPHPVLKAQARPVENFKKVREIAKDMFKLMLKSGGIGLAAPQVGISQRFFAMCLTGKVADAVMIINPEVVEVGEPVTGTEGCLSFPGKSASIVRPEEVEFTYFDLDGEPRRAVAEGLEARCFLHEFDHLNGVTIFDEGV